MSAATLVRYVGEYAEQVRSHLGDLAPEQIDDLTDGLEADLIEALEDPDGPAITGEVPVVGADAGAAGGGEQGVLDAEAKAILSLAARFGPPRAYAEELRSAAGLPAPERDPNAPADARRRAAERVARMRGRVTGAPWWPAFSDFCVAIRPVWWALRAWVLFFIGFELSGGSSHQPVPSTVVEWLALTALLIVSVQCGRGRWRWTDRRAGRSVMTVVNVVVIVFLLPVVLTASNVGTTTNVSYSETGWPQDGLWVDGEQVTNLFVYDADGTYIERAQILDDRGQPLDLGLQQGQMNRDWTAYSYWLPAQDLYGRSLWNVFPLQTWDELDEYWDEEPVAPAAAATEVPPPVARLAPLADPTAESGSEPTQPEPTASAPDPAAPAPEPTDNSDTK